jgi:hypothetical protein
VAVKSVLAKRRLDGVMVATIPEQLTLPITGIACCVRVKVDVETVPQFNVWLKVAVST